MNKRTAETIPSMTKGDFAVPQREGYRYPFRHEPVRGEPFDEATLSEQERQALEQGIEEERKRVEHVVGRFERLTSRRMQELVDKTGGPVLEIGGPSVGGYQLLNNVVLPEKPIMTNLWGSGHDALHGKPEKASDTLVSLDRLVLDGLMRSQELAIKDESMGIVLYSFLSPINVDATTSSEQQAEAVTDSERQWQAFLDDELSADQGRELIDSSPRLGAIIEARRVLKPGGLMLTRGVDIIDMEIAEKLGFEIVGYTSETYTEIGEVVYRKPERQE